MKRLLIICLVTLLSCSPRLQAADLLEIYNKALQQDPQLESARAQYQADAEAVPQSRAALLPNLSLSANTQTIDRVTEGSISRLDERFNANGYSAQLTQPLFRADSWFEYGAAKAGREQARALFEQAELDLMLRVATAYFNVLRAEDNLAAAQAREAAFRQQFEQANERFRVGLVAATDVYEAQAGYDLAKVERISRVEERNNSFAALTRLTNQPYSDLQPLDKKRLITGPGPAELNYWIDRAIEYNHQLAASRYQVQASKAQVRAAQSGHLPTLDATATYSHDEQGGTTFLGNETDTETFALELTLPLFEGGGQRSRVREAHFRHEQAKQDYEDTYREIRESIQTQHRTVTTDVQRISARRAALRSSEAALEATQGGYEVGTRNIVDVLQAQNTLFENRRDYANTIYDYIINLLTLKQLAGTLTPADLTDLNGWLEPAGRDNDTPDSSSSAAG